ncbi:endolytic transglycosylase MltG [Chlorobium sp. BLA1]|uniref:endolytic transglycosylase MltG n=1 Tax=Candidatus Chlorobium masyuteum TaxID=2716876 RepID=UPI00141DB1A5|nr:endolytic transglycosylase MltG [Candidatus Chlorobium masyuteum]NHQ59629.1 endolytic transglycosylase MltG [Candidatus Chlorobium masyuteum]
MALRKVSLPKPLLAASALLLTALGFFLFWPGLNTATTITPLVVHRKTGFQAIVGELSRNGTIQSKWPVLITGSIIPRLHSIKPGRYSIPPGMSNFMLLYYLHSHKQDEVRITLPEGINLEKVARILSGKLDFDSTAFMAAASSERLLRRYNIKAKNAEGYLLPGTYDFAWGGSPDAAAGFLVKRFRKFYTDSLKTVTARRGMNETGLLTLASIVEAETPLDSEKPVVASVYLNRLKKNMRLQADPTVQYALGGTARRLYYRDLVADSPYNTYRHNGLPPGPICNPGTASILAVLQPAETGFLYFVATGTGGHNFAVSLKEHNENIKKYRQARRNTAP